MARNSRPGLVAARVFAYGDADTMASGQPHRDMLEAYKSMDLRSLREEAMRFVGRPRRRRDAIERRIAANQARRAAHREELKDRIDVVQRWRDVGIRERMTIRSIPRVSKWMLWLLIAALDFYIFAQVIAYAEDIPDPGVGDRAFWLGGSVGIVVFIVGILLAQAIRRASYYMAQKRLLKELVAEGADVSGLRLSNYSRLLTIVFAVFYVLLTAGALVLRYQGGGKAQPGLLLLQTSIPVVAIMLELLVDDPTHVRVQTRSITDWYLDTRKARLDRKVELREEIAREREAAVSDRYRFERAALNSLHDSHGMEIERIDA